MALSSYSDLLSAVADWLNRDDLTSRIPDFVTLFEARVNRILRVPQMEVAYSTSNSDETIALPSDCLQVREVAIDGNPDTVLIPMTPSELRANYPNSATDSPVAYAIIGQTIKFAPPPSAAFALNLLYYRSIPSLQANDTNWLMTAHPDAYLFGTLCEASAFLIDDNRAGTWKQAWDSVLAEIMEGGNKYRTPGAPLTMRGAIE